MLPLITNGLIKTQWYPDVSPSGPCTDSYELVIRRSVGIVNGTSLRTFAGCRKDYNHMLLIPRICFES